MSTPTKDLVLYETNGIYHAKATVVIPKVIASIPGISLYPLGFGFSCTNYNNFRAAIEVVAIIVAQSGGHLCVTWPKGPSYNPN